MTLDYSDETPGSPAPTPGALFVSDNPNPNPSTTPVAPGVNAEAVLPMAVAASNSMLANTVGNAIILAIPQAAASLGFSAIGLTATGATIALDTSPDGVNWLLSQPIYQPGSQTQSAALAGDALFRLAAVAGAAFARFRVSVAGSNAAPIVVNSVLSNATLNIGMIGNSSSASGSIGSVQIAGGTAALGTMRQTALVQSSNLITLSAPIISAATTNALLLKNGAANLFGGVFANTAATWAYVKFYAKATAPVPGTDTPFLVLALPPVSNTVLNLQSIGSSVALGLGVAITLNAALNDATALAAANTVVGHVQYS